MSIPVILSCPLGHKCETIQGEAVHRCHWFVTLQGVNPQSGERVDERGCAMQWLPILLVENSREVVNSTAAVESLRNIVAVGSIPSGPILLS